MGQVEDRRAQAAGQHPLGPPVPLQRVAAGTDAEPGGRRRRRVGRHAPLARASRSRRAIAPPGRVVAVRRARPGRARSRGGSCRGRRPRSAPRSAARSAPASARRTGRSRPAAWRCRRRPPSRRGRAPRGGTRPSRRRRAGPRTARYDAAPTAPGRPRRLRSRRDRSGGRARDGGRPSAAPPGARLRGEPVRHPAPRAWSARSSCWPPRRSAACGPPRSRTSSRSSSGQRIDIGPFYVTVDSVTQRRRPVPGRRGARGRQPAPGHPHRGHQPHRPGRARHAGRRTRSAGEHTGAVAWEITDDPAPRLRPQRRRRGAAGSEYINPGQTYDVGPGPPAAAGHRPRPGRAGGLRLHLRVRGHRARPWTPTGGPRTSTRWPRATCRSRSSREGAALVAVVAVRGRAGRRAGWSPTASTSRTRQDPPFFREAAVGQVAHLDVRRRRGDRRPPGPVPRVPQLSDELARIAGGVFVLVSTKVTATREPTRFLTARLVDRDGLRVPAVPQVDAASS